MIWLQKYLRQKLKLIISKDLRIYQKDQNVYTCVTYLVLTMYHYRGSHTQATLNCNPAPNSWWWRVLDLEVGLGHHIKVALFIEKALWLVDLCCQTFRLVGRQAMWLVALQVNFLGCGIKKGRGVKNNDRFEGTFILHFRFQKTCQCHSMSKSLVVLSVWGMFFGQRSLARKSAGRSIKIAKKTCSKIITGLLKPW